jgi:hypothetical protein
MVCVLTAAAGDGNSDDTDAIQAAVDAATATGGTVFLPKGFYRVSRTINMTARALVRSHHWHDPAAARLLVSRDMLADWSRSQSECCHAYVRRPYWHARIASSCVAFPPAVTRFAARAAVHVYDVHCHMGTPGQCVGYLVAEQPRRLRVSRAQSDAANTIIVSGSHMFCRYRQCYVYRITECFYASRPQTLFHVVCLDSRERRASPTRLLFLCHLHPPQFLAVPKHRLPIPSLF